MSPDQMAIHAVGLPEWADYFDSIGAGIEHYRDDFDMAFLYKPEDFPKVYYPPENARAFQGLVVAALLGDDIPAARRLPRRDAVPFRQAEEVVRLRVEQRMSWPKIEEAESVQLSHRKIDYIRAALDHGDLEWDLDRKRLTLGTETRNTAAGLVLPPR